MVTGFVGALAFVVFWSVGIGLIIFMIDVIRRLVRAVELGAEARMRQAQAIETLSKRGNTPNVPKE